MYVYYLLSSLNALSRDVQLQFATKYTKVCKNFHKITEAKPSWSGFFILFFSCVTVCRSCHTLQWIYFLYKQFCMNPRVELLLNDHLRRLFVLKLGFPPCKTEQSLQSMDVQEKEDQKDEEIRKKPKGKRFLLTLKMESHFDQISKGSTQENSRVYLCEWKKC